MKIKIDDSKIMDLLKKNIRKQSNEMEKKNEKWLLVLGRKTYGADEVIHLLDKDEDFRRLNLEVLLEQTAEMLKQ